MYYDTITETLRAILAKQTLDAEFSNGCLTAFCGADDADLCDTWLLSINHCNLDVTWEDMEFMLVVADTAAGTKWKSHRVIVDGVEREALPPLHLMCDGWGKEVAS